MRPNPEKSSHKVKKEEDDFPCSFPSNLDSTFQEPVDVISSSENEDEDEDDSQTAEDEDSQSNENASKQLVVYDPVANGTGEIESISDPIDCQAPPFPGLRTSHHPSSRVLPSVGAFTVQCANCFKWRLIPTKEKYEEIREHILEYPFVCETAREWRPDISCDDPADIHQDGSRLWAIDKPNIAQPPPGWQRLLRIRGEGSTKFADVYYVAPSGKRLRSMVEIQRYLYNHPEYASETVQPSQFSFQTPKPLQENYVRKRPARLSAPDEVSKQLEPSEVNPLAWAGPADNTELQLGGPGLSAPYFEAPVFDPVGRPSKKQARRAPSKQMYSNQPYNQHRVKVEEPHKYRYDL